MQLSPLVFMFLHASGSIHASTSVLTPSIKDDESDDPIDFEVELDVECKGSDIKKVNLHNGIYAGKALQESFAKVHAEADDGDHILKYVVFGGNLDPKVASDPQGPARRKLRGDSVAEDTEVSGNNWWWEVGFYLFGGYSCRFCYEPDDDTLQAVGRKKDNKVHKAWEKEFEALLLANPNDAFHGIHDCSIIVITEPSLMHPRPEDANTEQVDATSEHDVSVTPAKTIETADTGKDDKPDEFAVEVDVSCKGMDVKNDKDLGSYIGFSLMKSYNDAHLKFDDDHVMKHIHYEGIFDDRGSLSKLRDDSGGSLRRGNWWWDVGFYLFGGYSCRFCYEPDDDTLLELDRKRQADVHKVWQDGFMSLLWEHPDKAFSSVAKCRITVIKDEDRMRFKSFALE